MIEVTKNSREVIRIERQDFRGYDILNVRVFYDDGSGEYRPGKQGLAIRTELVPDLLDAIHGAVSVMEAA
ncbi:MAG: transcriptional coactivator p15/PC4 family protein [Pseudomonadota bacterium]